MSIINFFKNLRVKATKTATSTNLKPEVSNSVDNLKSDTELLSTTEGNGNKGHVVSGSGNGIV